MSVFASPSVYKIGRVASVLAATLCPCLAYAQEAPAAAAPAAAPPAAAPEISPELAQRLDEIDQRSRIVDRKLELIEEAAIAKKKEAPTFYADDKGFGLSSADKAFDLKIKALLQIDGRRFFDADPALQDKDTFLPRRVRPTLEGTLLGLVDYRITPDFGNGQTQLLDAYLDAHPAPWLRLRVGKMKPPIGLERLQADQNVALPERALDANLTSQRDVGVQLWGEIANAALRYEIGIYNGDPDNTVLDLDNNHAKTYIGRIFVRPFQLGGLGWLGDLGVGFAGETGNEKGSAAVTNGAASNTWLPTFRSAGQNTIFSYLSSTTDTNLTVFAFKRHTRLNPELYYYNGPLGVLFDFVHEYQEVQKGAELGSVNNDSAHVTASWVIGGTNTFDGVKPFKVAEWATKQVGAVEIAARWGWLNVDNAAFQGTTLANPATSVSAAQEWDVGVNWWLNRNIRATGAWMQTSFTGGNSTGSGASRVITDRATEKVLVGRLQINF